ncbi:MAG: hypothetical protein ABEJ65_11205, partial [bacterium]
MNKAVQRACHRIVAYDWEAGAEGEGNLTHLDTERWVHATISDERFYELGVKEARRLAADLADEAGYEGASIVYHPYRIREPIKKILRQKEL